MHPQTHIPNHLNDLDKRAGGDIWRLLNRKIWLPKSLYTALPYLYIGLGSYAIFATLLLKHWTWIIPYFLLFGIICLHAGLIVATLRWRNRKDTGEQ